MNKPVRILLVDDYQLVRTTLARCLTEVGFEVTEAGDGVEALNHLHECAPDAIICDVSMPRMDGFQLRAVLQADEQYQSIPFIFLTARDSEEEVLQGLALEPDDYLSKNVSQAVLLKKLDTIIKRHCSERKAATADLVRASVDAGVQLLPEHPPIFPGFSIVQLHKPYQEIPGGDFFDYIRFANDTLIIVLGDVMGKKWSAWMFAHAYMAYVRSTIRSLASSQEHTRTPAAILQQLNTMLCNDGSTAEVLCTLSVVRLCSTSSKILYATAAHVPALLFTHSTASILAIDQGGAPIGYSLETKYCDRTIDMAEGDMLLLTTDGVTDASSSEGNGYGEEALPHTVQKHQNRQCLLETIYQEALQFSSSTLLEDDATLIEIRRRSL